MPVHDWTKVDLGLFHHFRQRRIGALCDDLNGGRLPADYFALVEQNIHGPNPDLILLRSDSGKPETVPTSGTGLPNTRRTRRSDADSYLKLANRVALRHRHGRLKAAIDIVSPGNKANAIALRAYILRSADLIAQGFHLLVIDLLPPTPHDPQGIGKAIWDEFAKESLEPFPERPLTLVSFDAGADRTMCLEPVAIGETLPDMPLGLHDDSHVEVALEATYQAAFAAMPAPMKALLGA